MHVINIIIGCHFFQILNLTKTEYKNTKETEIRILSLQMRFIPFYTEKKKFTQKAAFKPVFFNKRILFRPIWGFSIFSQMRREKKSHFAAYSHVVSANVTSDIFSQLNAVRIIEEEFEKKSFSEASGIVFSCLHFKQNSKEIIFTLFQSFIWGMVQLCSSEVTTSALKIRSNLIKLKVLSICFFFLS